MERTDRIINNESYKGYMQDIEAAEADREFCGHGMEHCLDVARIMLLLNYEEKLNIPKETVYAAALLHDIGRGEQYLTGTPHETAGVRIAGDILTECGFETEERKQLLEAIGSHRNQDIREEPSLVGILYRADKLSRACYACKAEAKCDWDQAKKNMSVRY